MNIKRSGNTIYKLDEDLIGGLSTFRLDGYHQSQCVVDKVATLMVNAENVRAALTDAMDFIDESPWHTDITESQTYRIMMDLKKNF
jgi:hypothetical protein